MNDVLPSPNRSNEHESGINPKLLWMWRWFWRLMLIISPFVIWYCYYAPNNDIAWADSFETGRMRSVQTGKPMILFFTGKWCVPCRIMKRNVWADDDVASIVNDGFVPIMIHAEDPMATELFRRYGVRATPHSIVIDSAGNVVRQRFGGISKPEFLRLLGATSPDAHDL